jgi:hypothetical protein
MSHETAAYLNHLVSKKVGFLLRASSLIDRLKTENISFVVYARSFYRFIRRFERRKG